jgi:hypothetical protein
MVRTGPVSGYRQVSSINDDTDDNHFYLAHFEVPLKDFTSPKPTLS